ncbi:Predicted PurR-regulated permease PerM [Nitrosospira sp. Nsp14]|uniref:AI-2E family transporter n=1 Tax=Nitrosospira sp. Nsp14 TaxID=1855333 RepID=UPI0008F1C2E8|nr:AI-2E family transporter [Nitrosospira sp. Nsp14]SFH59424.1 Predicted PurR-regulated permease PerM [Nitrosospira sp. Nsp14]
MKSLPGEPQGESKGALHEVGPSLAADSTPDIGDERGPGYSALYHPKVATALWILALVALVAVLHLARAFFVPLLFGILVSYTLGPIVDWFERYHVPRAIASALVLGALVGGTSWMALSLSADTEAIIERLPEAARKLRQNLHNLLSSSPSTLERVREAAAELENAAVDAGLKSEAAPVVITQEPDASTWLRDFILTQAALLVAFAAQAPVVLLLTYFLLAAGTHFRRKLVKIVGPSLTQKKDAVRILEEVDVQIQRYLLVILITNILIAVLTWLAFEAIGLEHAGAWGVAAGVLRFIPYLGTVTIVMASGISGLLQFGTLTLALSVGAASVVVSFVVGMVFTTWLQGRVARVNAAVLFIVLLFFAWLWGLAGLLLGAPLLAIAKVVCDRVESLKPVGELLGR